MNEDNKKVVYTYDPAEIQKKTQNKKSGWKKGLIIAVLIIAFIIAAGALMNYTGVTSKLNIGMSSGSEYSFNEDYIGVLPIHGTIGESGGEYDQSWILERISQMAKDEHNKGMVLSLDTPGGAVYETDEVYLAVKAYKETNKPVYAYMESMAASGGYYISAPCDKIYANRNCWTGSIGVTIGTFYDVSEFLKKNGVKTVTITSGANKAMGSYVDPMTAEQKEIFQGLVDEAYEQFTEIVAEGRNIEIDKVKKLADGRIYTAKQAKEKGLIDEISTFNEAVNAMKEEYKITDCEIKTFDYDPPISWQSIIGMIAQDNKSKSLGEYEGLLKVMEENNKFTITYMAQARK